MGILDKKEKVGSFIFLAFSMAYGYIALQIPINILIDDEIFTARTLPLGLAVIGVAISMLQILLPASNADNNSIKMEIKNFAWAPFIFLTILMFLYGLVFKYLGFVLATILFLMIGFRILNEKRPLVLIIVAFAMTFSFWFILNKLLGLYLDPGELYFLLMKDSA